jgi:hypothetical protein
VSRRVKLPGADELFGANEKAANGRREQVVVPMPDHASAARAEPPDERRGPSGRVRHDEKITVYVTAEELLDLERVRLALRSEHGLGVDRGRIVREAIHLAIESVGRDGDASPLVQRLRET